MDHDTWRWVTDDCHTAEWNMAEDAALLAGCGQGRIPPTVRFYGWSEPAITIGYSQDPSKELDLERCRELGIPVIRRPTGGRALLHHRELTYAVVAPVSLSPFDRGLKTTFQAVSEGLLAGLDELGIQGDTCRESGRSGRRERSPACFATLNHCEITVDGRKLVGSAQKRTAKAFLQHGSVIVESDHELFTSLLKFNSEKERQITRERLMHSTTSLNQVCARNLSFGEISAAFLEGFRRTLGEICLRTG